MELVQTTSDVLHYDVVVGGKVIGSVFYDVDRGWLARRGAAGKTSAHTSATRAAEAVAGVSL